MSTRTLLKLVILVVAAVVVPACGTSDKNQPPLIVAWTPAAPGNVSVGRMPNIIVKFDRAMAPATVTNLANWAVVASGAPSGVPLSQVEYLPELFEARIVPTSILDGNTLYGVFIGGGVTSAEGVSAGSYLAFDFTTNNAATASAITWGGAAAAGGALAGQITLTWTAAMEGANAVSDYDVFLATTSGAEDLLVRSGILFATFASATGGTIGGLTPGTPYFIKVQPRSGTTGCVFTALAEITATATP